MSIWASIGREDENIHCYLDEYGADEPRVFDIATSGNGLVRIASFGVDGDGKFEAQEMYVRVEDINLVSSFLATAAARSAP